MQILVKIKSLDRTPDRKEASKEAYALLSEMLTDRALPDSTVKKDGNGRPYIERTEGDTAPRFDFSLSHAGRHIAVVLAVAENESEQPRVGIDVEIPHERISKEKLAGRFFSSNEKARLEKCGYSDAEFLRIWTRKESYLKFVGTGLSGGMKEADTENIDALGVTFTEYGVEGDGDAVVTVCTDNAWLCPTPS